MEKVDVVYKLGIGSRFNDAELRYSLRSLKNFLPLRNVYLVGHRPNWVTNVIHIPAIDAYKNNKDGNLISKLILATVDKDLSAEFLNMSDDQLFLKSCSYEDIKVPYIDNIHIQFVEGKRLNRWEQRLRNSIVALQQDGLPTNCFEAHIPTLLGKKNYASILFRYPYGEDRGMVGNTLYFNTLKTQGKEGVEQVLARVIEKTIQEREDVREVLRQLCKDKMFLNYSQGVEGEQMFGFLQELFPEKSKYEL